MSRILTSPGGFSMLLGVRDSGDSPAPATGPLKAGLRHVAIFVSGIAELSRWTRTLGEVEASRVASRLLALQEIIITRDGAGQILECGTGSVFAVFDSPSLAINRALEVQRVLGGAGGIAQSDAGGPRVRIGLHIGEVLVREGERIEIISRHVQRARKVMEMGAAGQILGSATVVEAARDFIDLPREHLAIRNYGEFSLSEVGPAELCEVADTRVQSPAAPAADPGTRAEAALHRRLELAGYRCLSRMGEGACGVVYRAEQLADGREVAVKVLAPALAAAVAARQRFADVALRVQMLQNPGLPALVEERLDHQPPFVVTDLQQGVSIEAVLGGAPPERVAKVMRGVCLLLDQAHAARAVHGGIKPGNVLVRPDDTPVILDFGVSLLLREAQTARAASVLAPDSPAYLAPEIIQGAEASIAGDIYALGVLLFRILAGREPFVGESVHHVIQGHLYEDPPLPGAFRSGVSEGLQRICLKALEKQPADRYANLSELIQDLDRVIRGEMVRTRPSVYDNLLFHRVRKHVGQVREWAKSGLLSAEESHALLSAYSGLQRRGLPAIMESRFHRIWQTLVYLGGWAVINGAVLWLMQQWSTLSKAQQLSLGSVPAVTAFLLAVAMWKLERFRLTHVALIVAVLAVPLLAGVWLMVYEVAAAVPPGRLAYEVLHDTPDSGWLTNSQILVMTLATFCTASGIMAFTRTTTHSAQSVVALVFLYSAALLCLGLKVEVDHERWANVGLWYIPLLVAVTVFAFWLVPQPQRSYQAPPWIYSGAILLMAILFLIAFYGLKEWTSLKNDLRLPASYLMLALAGGVQVGLGLLARQQLRHHGRLATWFLITSGLVAVLASLGMAGEEWPPHWLQLTPFGRNVPVTHAAMPLVALAIALLACRYQMLSFLLVGLAGFAFSIHLLGYRYFDQVSAWPKLLMVAGTLCFFVALWIELRRTRGNVIDDTVAQTRL